MFEYIRCKPAAPVCHECRFACLSAMWKPWNVTKRASTRRFEALREEERKRDRQNNIRRMSIIWRRFRAIWNRSEEKKGKKKERKDIERSRFKIPFKICSRRCSLRRIKIMRGNLYAEITRAYCVLWHLNDDERNIEWIIFNEDIWKRIYLYFNRDI